MGATNEAGLDTKDLKQIDEVCEAFESAWKNEQSPDLEDYCARLDDGIRIHGLTELVVLDAHYRTDSTHQSADQLWSGYVDLFPILEEVACPPELNASSPLETIENRFEKKSLLATGGLGQVSIADDLQFGRTVAIKEMRSRFLSNDELQRRFFREAEVAGRLEHPSIVPVYCKGVKSDGHPYYAMRLVQGQSLLAAIKDYHASAQPGLTIALRKLFQRVVDVCDAVEYAHSQNVIHRDIKPNNIMLGKYGETILVDWGLAKIQGHCETRESEIETDKNTATDETEAGTVLGTPAYMSPEQIDGDGESVDARSDVYSLGATLYHLATGTISNLSPGYQHAKLSNDRYQKTDLTELQPIIAISQKAMHIQPDQRYQSARQLADDIELFLADRPIDVFRDSWPTQCLRWVRNHRGMSGAIAAASVATVLGSLLFAWVYGQHASEIQNKNDALDKMVKTEQQSRSKAELSASRTRDAMRYLVNAMRSPDPNFDGRNIKVVDVLQQAVDRLDEDFSDDPLMLAQMLRAIGSTYGQLGDFQEAVSLTERSAKLYSEQLGQDHTLTLGTQAKLAEWLSSSNNPRARETINDVVNLSRSTLGDEHVETLEFRRVKAVIELADGKTSGAVEQLEQLLPSFEKQFGQVDTATITLMNDLANAYYHNGQYEYATRLSRQVYEIRLADGNAGSLRTITNGSNYASHLLKSSGGSEARILLQALLITARESLGNDHYQTLAIMSKLGTTLVRENNLSSGIPLLQESLDRSERIYGTHHSRSLVAANGLAMAQFESGDYETAATNFEKVYRASIETRGKNHRETLTVANNLASTMRLKKQYDRAIEVFTATIEAQKESVGEHHPDTLRSMLNLIATLQESKKFADSIPVCQNVYQLACDHIGKDSQPAQTALSLEAMAHLSLNQFQQAKQVLIKGLESRTRTIPNHWLRYNTMSLLGETHLKLDELETAEKLLLESYENMLGQQTRIPKRALNRLDQARARLVQLYTVLGKPDLVAKYRE
ncbi:MAG: serine/threonine-protein kinase [Planctomycetota bacterium]